jgi:hypothetical protein
VLTLDQEGSLAVYIGRAGCGGEPGRDILIFRPTSAEDEEGVDVSVITQVLEPIITQRIADGTAIFEAYGDQHRKLVAPDEITMLCIDLSKSMSDRCGFIDIQSNEDSDMRLSGNVYTNDAISSQTNVEDPAFPLPDSDELKEYLKTHESYDDFLAIIRTGTNDYQQRLNAEKVLKILQQIDYRQIEARCKRQESLRQHTSHSFYRRQADDIERELGILRNRSFRLHKYKNLICAWFLSSVAHEDTSSNPLTCKPGDPVPEISRTPESFSNPGPIFEMPHEYCYHISSDVMEDPVVTVDLQTYDRKNIE